MIYKYLAIGLFCFATYVGNAQQTNTPTNKNEFFNPSFWQNKPTVEDVKAAIAKGNDPAELNNIAMDAVVLAIIGNAPTASIQYLLEQKGNDVAKLTHDSRTYLFWAAMRGNTDIVRYLLSKGAKVNVQDSHGMTPTSFAAAVGRQNTQVYDLLIQHGENLKTDLNGDGANVLLLSIGNDTSLALTQYFQSKGLGLDSRDADGNNAFDYAARSGNIKAMKWLQQKGILPTKNAMLMAVQGGRGKANTIEVFQYLESVGAAPTAISKNGENALHYASRRTGNEGVVTYFLTKGLDVNQKDKEGNTPFLNAAASNRDTKIIGLLFTKVKNINDKNNTGASALALAVRNNNAQVVDYLLGAGADIKTTDKSGNSLVSYLFESYSPRQAQEFESKIKTLQGKGLELDQPLADGNTIYHLAVAKNDLDLVSFVHDNYRIDLNAKNKEGLTALQRAAMVARDDKILKYLVANGADKQLKTNFDETAFDLADENEVLKKNGISIDFLK
ncbi:MULTISPECIES: ankyrin repeat domain-containing protein [Chitinophagaceae]